MLSLSKYEGWIIRLLGFALGPIRGGGGGLEACQEALDFLDIAPARPVSPIENGAAQVLEPARVPAEFGEPERGAGAGELVGQVAQAAKGLGRAVGAPG